jgi:glutamate racemase
MIGIFDSGIGGLNVAREIKAKMPDSQILYFGDAARYPWGNKSPELIRKYSVQISEFLLAEGAQEIVIACNTASTFAADHLREIFPKINFYDVITPVIERISEEADRNKDKPLTVGIIGTRGTIENGIYERKLKCIDANIGLISKACPLYVPIAEEGMGEHLIAKVITEEYLFEIKREEPDFLILGCTHYPLLNKTISAYLGDKTKIISSAEEIAKKIRISVPTDKQASTQDIYYFSDLTKHYDELAAKIMGKSIMVKKHLLV